MRESLRLGGSVVSATLSLIYRPEPLRDELEEKVIAIADPSRLDVDILERPEVDLISRFGVEHHGLRYLVSIDADTPGIAVATRPVPEPTLEWGVFYERDTVPKLDEVPSERLARAIAADPDLDTPPSVMKRTVTVIYGPWEPA